MYTTDASLVRLGFIPDICKLLGKYNLELLLDEFLNNNNLPSKRTWKNIVYNKVEILENELWDKRLSVDSDFMVFRSLHLHIKPAIVYQSFNQSASRNTMRFIANLWSRSASLENSTCRACGQTIQDYVLHIIGECANTVPLRSTLTSTISTSFDQNFAHEYELLDPISLALRLLGAPIEPLLSVTDNKIFLSHSYNYILKCFKTTSAPNSTG